MELLRKGNEVFFEGKKLTIVPQATKGPGKEVVRVDGLPGSNGQKFISLSRLKEGTNVIELQGKEGTSSGSKSKEETYVLTEAEKAEVAELQGKIDSIIQKAKERYVPRPKNYTQEEIEAMSDEEKAEVAAQVEKWLISIGMGHLVEKKA